MLKHLSPVVLVCISACGSAEVVEPGPPPVDPRVYQPAAVHAEGTQKSPLERDRENAAAFGRALADNDTKALTALLDPDVDFSYPGMSSATDLKGTLEALSALFGPFSARKLTPTRSFQIGEAAIVEWTMSGTQTGAFMATAPTQKAVAFSGATLLWFNLNGLINEVHIYFDSGAILAELGGAPSPTIQAPPAAAPSGAPTITLAAGSAEEKAEVATVNASWDALESRSEAGYLAPIAEDIEVWRLDRAAPERGKEERRRFFRWVTQGISSLSQTPLNAWAAGNFVIEEYTLAGVHSGKLLSSPPSGHALRLHYLDVDEMRDGKIVRSWVYGNSLELYAEAGVIPSASPLPASAPAPSGSGAPAPAKGAPAKRPPGKP